MLQGQKKSATILATNAVWRTTTCGCEARLFAIAVATWSICHEKGMEISIIAMTIIEFCERIRLGACLCCMVSCPRDPLNTVLSGADDKYIMHKRPNEHANEHTTACCCSDGVHVQNQFLHFHAFFVRVCVCMIFLLLVSGFCVELVFSLAAFNC